MALKKRRLGKTDLYVTEIGFGGIPIQRISEEDAISVVKRCYELGINYYDTARGYTTSEERIGKALEGIRDNVYLATKSHAKTAKELRENLVTSLRNLRADYLDLYQLHNVTLDTYKNLQAPGGAIEELLKIKEEGLVRHIGVTSHSPTFLTKIVSEGSPFETIMVGYNYIALEPSRELLPRARDEQPSTNGVDRQHGKADQGDCAEGRGMHRLWIMRNKMPIPVTYKETTP